MDKKFPVHERTPDTRQSLCEYISTAQRDACEAYLPQKKKLTNNTPPIIRGASTVAEVHGR
jgi:hypothetical protein